MFRAFSFDGGITAFAPFYRLTYKNGINFMKVPID